jgi:hypothetical protein
VGVGGAPQAVRNTNKENRITVAVRCFISC